MNPRQHLDRCRHEIRNPTNAGNWQILDRRRLELPTVRNNPGKTLIPNFPD
jgi:hypothetical protein